MAKRKLSALKREALKAWGKVILTRQPMCLVCKSAPSKHPHHLFPRARYRHLHYDLRNGVGLCIKCHYQIHYDPFFPITYLLLEDGMPYLDDLAKDAVGGRRKNPYKRQELENIIIALKGAM